MLAVGLLILVAMPVDALVPNVQITYSLTGSATDVSITMTNGEGGIEQTKSPLPWSRSLVGKSGKFVSISAQNQGDYGDGQLYDLRERRPVPGRPPLYWGVHHCRLLQGTFPSSVGCAIEALEP